MPISIIFRIVAEQRQPRGGKAAPPKPDHFGDASGDDRTGPRHAQGALAVPAPMVVPTIAATGAPSAEHQRHQQIFKPSTGAISGNRGGADQTGEPSRGRYG